jgi:type IV pilus assembly protein PilC
MPTFAYVARTAQGQVSRGTIEAPDERSALQQLRQQGLVITSLRRQEAARPAQAGQRASFGAAWGRVKLKDMALFCRQLATLINAGVSLVRALAVLERQTQNARLRYIIRQLTHDVEDGMLLSRAMAKFPASSPTSSSEWCGLAKSAASWTKTCNAWRPSWKRTWSCAEK